MPPMQKKNTKIKPLDGSFLHQNLTEIIELLTELRRKAGLNVGNLAKLK